MCHKMVKVVGKAFLPRELIFKLQQQYESNEIVEHLTCSLIYSFEQINYDHVSNFSYSQPPRRIQFRFKQDTFSE